MVKYGFSWSWKRATGISSLEGKVARATGVPTTKRGRQAKIGRIVGSAGLPLLVGSGTKAKAERRASSTTTTVVYECRPLMVQLFGGLLTVIGIVGALIAGVSIAVVDDWRIPAVTCAGMLVLASYGRSRMRPRAWGHLEN